MSREIKFRALNQTINGVYYWQYYLLGQFLDPLINLDSISQFTGLKDKNGKEIYEGDIVKFQHLLCEVYFAYGTFILKYPNGNIFPDRDFAWGELEVIGNIYENPELLKESDIK